MVDPVELGPIVVGQHQDNNLCVLDKGLRQQLGVVMFLARL